jgi:hypothetical protein
MIKFFPSYQIYNIIWLNLPKDDHHLGCIKIPNKNMLNILEEILDSHL